MLLKLCFFDYTKLSLFESLQQHFQKPLKVSISFRVKSTQAEALWLIGTIDACFLFLLGHFQLTSAKFQTFAYNSRMVRSRYMKFGQ